MASNKKDLDYLLWMLSDIEDDLSYEEISGDYKLSYKGVEFGGLYNDRLLVRAIDSAKALLLGAEFISPCDGSEEMLLVDVIDEVFLQRLIEEMYCELTS